MALFENKPLYFRNDIHIRKKIGKREKKERKKRGKVVSVIFFYLSGISHICSISGLKPVLSSLFFLSQE